MSAEKLPKNNQNERLSSRELEREAEKALERAQQQYEREVRTNPEKDLETRSEARKEALEQAAATEKMDENKETETKQSQPERQRGKRTKKELDQAYTDIMRETRAEMPKPQKAFSKLIHNRAVEAGSEAVGSTIARPNAILAGSVSAFIIVLGTYLVARYFGYPLSGSETLIAFAGGWLIGILFDFLRVMITGKK